MKSVKWSENRTRGSPDTDMCVVILFSVTPVPTSSARATVYYPGLRETVRLGQDAGQRREAGKGRGRIDRQTDRRHQRIKTQTTGQN
ncbi:hypothetical protein E2C01_014864 [Portunus trituberculatus]|uniref:Uncharacterized protein n=1 Tax=Portunus trituberculatus TaxID=210409 RepID=A0A5B7DJU1_PORTR|nr:hypothetical protein [Portunus trituberculatus]